MRTVIAISLLAALASACGGTDSSPVASDPPAGDSTTSTSAASGRIVVRSAEGVEAYDLASGDRVVDLETAASPALPAAPEVAYRATADGDGTRIEALDTATGDTLKELRVDGAWEFPRPIPGGPREGVSADGSTLVLVAPGSEESEALRVAVLPATLDAAPRVLSLDGSFGYDTLSPDGQALFVLQYGEGEDPHAGYTVRAASLADGRLGPIIVDKADGEVEDMAGSALARATSADGSWAFTLYETATGDGRFVHALPTTSTAVTGGYSLCVDLPTGGGVKSWSIAVTRDASRLFAADAAQGTVHVADLASQGEIAVRSAALPSGGGEPGLVLGPDDATLYARSGEDLVALDPADLTMRRGRADAAPSGRLEVSSDGRWLVAIADGRATAFAPPGS
jgi:hypothetical protein